MKVTSILFAGALTIAGASAAATPDAQAFCNMPGQACSKLKRAADAAANALAYANPEPEARKVGKYHFCMFPGEPCSKAKRHADAIADAVSDAYAAAGVTGSDFALEHFRKRSAEAEPEAEALALAAADPAKKKGNDRYHFCWFPGEPCSKVKRAAEAVTEALALPEPEAKVGKYHFCMFPGEPCSKAKRAADALADAVNAAGLDLGF